LATKLPDYTPGSFGAKVLRLQKKGESLDSDSVKKFFSDQTPEFRAAFDVAATYQFANGGERDAFFKFHLEAARVRVEKNKRRMTRGSMR